MSTDVWIRVRLHTDDPGSDGLDNVSGGNSDLMPLCLTLKRGWSFVSEKNSPRFENTTGTEEIIRWLSLWSDEGQLQMTIRLETGFLWGRDRWLTLNGISVLNFGGLERDDA